MLLDTEMLLRDDDAEGDSTDPNYWVYLMHDLEIVAEPIEPPTSAGLAFYGKRTTRKTN